MHIVTMIFTRDFPIIAPDSVFLCSTHAIVIVTNDTFLSKFTVSHVQQG